MKKSKIATKLTGVSTSREDVLQLITIQQNGQLIVDSVGVTRGDIESENVPS